MINGRKIIGLAYFRKLKTGSLPKKNIAITIMRKGRIPYRKIFFRNSLKSICVSIVMGKPEAVKDKKIEHFENSLLRFKD
jgi:hypothetical protein